MNFIFSLHKGLNSKPEREYCLAPFLRSPQANACVARIADCEGLLEKIRKGMRYVLKIRLQGTKKELRWFLKGMERDSRYEVENISTFKPCDGDARFRRLYVNVRRKEKQRQNGKGVASGVKT